MTIINKNELALFGGPKTITREFKRYNPIGLEEVDAARKVVESGVLSSFVGANTKEFFGGPKYGSLRKSARNIST